jgi:hypothetical protein
MLISSIFVPSEHQPQPCAAARLVKPAHERPMQAPTTLREPQHPRFGSALQCNCCARAEPQAQKLRASPCGPLHSDLLHADETAGGLADFGRYADVGVRDLVTHIMGTKRERNNIPGIVEFRMMVHHLGLDGDLHDERDGVAKPMEREFCLDIIPVDGPIGQFGERFLDLVCVEYLMSHALYLREKAGEHPRLT